MVVSTLLGYLVGAFFCSMFASWDSLPLSLLQLSQLLPWHSFPRCCNFLQLAKTSRFSYYSGDYKIQELTVKAPTKFSPLFLESIFFRPSVLNKIPPPYYCHCGGVYSRNKYNKLVTHWPQKRDFGHTSQVLVEDTSGYTTTICTNDQVAGVSSV